jgi:hypothetical protein
VEIVVREGVMILVKKIVSLYRTDRGSSGSQGVCYRGESPLLVAKIFLTQCDIISFFNGSHMHVASCAALARRSSWVKSLLRSPRRDKGNEAEKQVQSCAKGEGK